MYERILPQMWMQLEKPIRLQIVKDFDIPRTGITEIRDQEVISDGYSVNDLSTITLEKMTSYIGSEETFPRAWEITCSKAKSIVYPANTLNPVEVFPMADEPKEEPIIIMAETEADTIEQAKVIIETKTTQHGTKKSK